MQNTRLQHKSHESFNPSHERSNQIAIFCFQIKLLLAQIQSSNESQPANRDRDLNPIAISIVPITDDQCVDGATLQH